MKRTIIIRDADATDPPGDAITIFKSNGLAVEDVVSAGYIYEAAIKKAASLPTAPASDRPGRL